MTSILFYFQRKIELLHCDVLVRKYCCHIEEVNMSKHSVRKSLVELNDNKKLQSGLAGLHVDDEGRGGDCVNLLNANGEQEKFFWAKYVAQWTVIDQKRLVSVDALFSRSLEFHNNIHSFRSWDIFEIIDNDVVSEEELDEIALEIAYFDETQFRQIICVSFRDTVRLLLELKPYSEKGLLWINIKDLSVLPLIARSSELKYLHMHRICLSGFYDLRGHSTILPCFGSFLLSLCGYRLDKAKDGARMYKTFVYNHHSIIEGVTNADGQEVSRKILFTYEHELMPDIDRDIYMSAEAQQTEADAEADSISWPKRPSELTVSTRQVNADMSNTTAYGVRATTTNPLSNAWGPTNPTIPEADDDAADDSSSQAPKGGKPFNFTRETDGNDILFNVQQRLPSMSTPHLMGLGTMLLVYEIAMEALHVQDDIVEFFSRTLFYFKQKVHIHLKHAEKLIIHRKMHIVIAALHIMSSNISECALCFMRLLDPPPSLKTMIKSNASVYRGSNHRGNTSFDSHSFSGGASTGSALASAAMGGTHLGERSVLTSTVDQTQSLSDEFIPYMYHLMDTYDYAKQCIGNSIESAKALHQTMDAVAQLRTDHTATTLSLIATVFLPLTFFAGVFGMNFEVHGGYTMSIINQTYGPNVFYGLCLINCVFCLYYFAKMGWIGDFTTPKWLGVNMLCFLIVLRIVLFFALFLSPRVVCSHS